MGVPGLLWMVYFKIPLKWMTGGSPMTSETSIFGQSQDGTSDGTGPRDPSVSHSQGGESAVGNASFSTDASMARGQPIFSDPVGK